MIDVTINGIITNAFQSNKNPQLCYIDVQVGRSQFSFSTVKINAATLEPVLGVPVKLVGKVSGRKFDRNQALRFEELQVVNPAAIKQPA